MLTRAELCRELSIDEKVLAQLERQGLPSRLVNRRRQFDPDQVCQWMIDRGYADDPDAPPPPPPPPPAPPPPVAQQNVVKTLGQVARHFDVSTRMVGFWKAEGMPAGAAGKGPYDLDAIELWKQGRDARNSPSGGDPERAKLQTERLELQLQRERIDLGERTGQVLDRRATLALVLEYHSEVRAVLEELRSILPAELPDDVSPQVKANVHRRVTERLDMSFATLAELARNLAGDATD